MKSFKEEKPSTFSEAVYWSILENSDRLLTLKSGNITT